MENDKSISQPTSTSNGEIAAASTNPFQNADDFVDAVSAAMPPSMAEKCGQDVSVDEIMKELNRVPLFMTTLDETDGEGGENVMLEAIKALAYEGTRAEVAANFREQGNEQARVKNWRDAREFYTKGIKAVRGEIETTEVEGDDDPAIKVVEVDDEEAEGKKEREIEEACLTNRALCNLEMKNYRSCTTDCAAALRLNPRNIKAWYRAGSACLALDKIPEAQDACTSGLQFDANNAALQTLSQKVSSRRDHLAELTHTRQVREEREGREKMVLRTALKARGILTREAGEQTPELEDATISLSDPNDPSSSLSFPLLLLYPLHAQTDFIKSFGEHDTLSEHLKYILPPEPWDTANEYPGSEAVECYMETVQGKGLLVKAGKKIRLGKLLGSGKVEVVDGLVRVFVVPKVRGEEWIGEFKRRGVAAAAAAAAAGRR